MSEQAPNPAGGPAPAPAVVAAPAPDKAFSIDDVSFEDGIAALRSLSAPPEDTSKNYGEGLADVREVKESVAPVAEKPSVAAAPAVVEPAKPVEAAPVAPAAEDDADPLEGIKGIKIKPQSFQDMEVLRLMKPRNGAPGLTLKEAYAKVYPDASPAVPAAAEVKPVAAAPAADPAIDALRAEITALETQSDKAAEDMDTKTANKLNREIMSKQAELRQIEADARAQAQAAETAKATEADTIFRQKSSESAKEVYAARPSLADKASADRTEFDAFTNLKFSDPDYKAIFDSPRWPSVLYREFAEAKGWNKAPAPVSAPALPAPTPGATAAPRATAATVLTPGDTPGGTAITAKDAIAEFGKMPYTEQMKILSTLK